MKVSTVWCAAAFSIAAFSTCCTSTLATDGPLLDEPPADEITLNAANDHAVLKVLPLNLPGRQVPSPPPPGSLKVTLVDRPAEVFEIPWSSIDRIRLHEQMLLEQAKQLTSEGRFDEAYDYFARLVDDYPRLPGLDEAVNRYLQKNALDAYQKDQYDRALALLGALYDRDSEYPGLGNAVEVVAGRVIEGYLRNQDFAAARDVLELWESHYRDVAPDGIQDWTRRFQLAAEQQLATAEELINNNEYRAARAAVRRSTEIWPDVAGAKELLARIDQESPTVVIGVSEQSLRDPRRQIDSWAAMRTSRLVQPTIAEIVDFGAEGGIYHSPLGEMQLDDTGRRLSLQVDLSPAVTHDAVTSPSYAIARYLLQMTESSSPLNRTGLEGLVNAISVDSQGHVLLDYFRPHVRPEALLQVSIPSMDWERGTTDSTELRGPFSIAEFSEDEVVFEAADQSVFDAGVRTINNIVEQSFDDDEAAVRALTREAIDVIDRVPPWQVGRLRQLRNIRVGTYRLPTVHVLIPNFDRDLPASREFRRAICYGIDRERVVHQILLGGTDIPGYVVLSGPFPAGTSLTDPIRYGFNNQLQPRPYEPRLAATLAAVAWSKLVDQRELPKDEPEPPLPDIVIVHPADAIARTACASIQLQLEKLDIPVTLKELSTEKLLAPERNYDFRYAELAVWEPVVDASVLLGPDGLVGQCSHPMHLALRHLQSARNWADVRTRLAAIHEVAHNELPVIPLWQTINYFAHRRALKGLEKSPVVLYQNVREWQE